MKKILFFLAVTMLTLFSSCTTTTYFIDGSYQIKETASNPKADNVSWNNQVYSDNFISMYPTVDGKKINLTIVNKHSSSIRILWDEAAYIDNDGSSHRVIHKTTKLHNKEQEQVPSVIPTGARLEDFVIPASYAFVTTEGWAYQPQVYNAYNRRESAESALATYKSNPYYSQTKLLLPIEIDGKKIEYTMSFTGSNFNIGSTTELDNDKTLNFTMIFSGTLTILAYLIAMSL